MSKEVLSWAEDTFTLIFQSLWLLLCTFLCPLSDGPRALVQICVIKVSFVAKHSTFTYSQLLFHEKQSTGQFFLLSLLLCPYCFKVYPTLSSTAEDSIHSCWLKAMLCAFSYIPNTCLNQITKLYFYNGYKEIE